MADTTVLRRPFTIKNLTIRNRIMSTSHAPGYAENGMPGEQYQLYHLEKAKGGIGLTMFGGSTSVALDSPLSFDQLSVADDSALPKLRTFAERIHAEGAALMCQITHIGRRGTWDADNWLPLINPSATREQLHRSYAKEMEDFDFRRVRRDYAQGARRLRDAGIDGTEIIASAHHLIDTFLSPSTNLRTDRYGSSRENRMRFGFEVLEAVRAEVGDDYILGMRLAGDELMRGGMDAEECLAVIIGFANSGLLDFVNVYQGNGDDFSSLKGMIPDLTFDSGAFLHLASAVKAETDIPVFHGSTIRDLATAARAVEEGHVDMIAMTRAQIADPHMIRKIIDGREDDIRQCVGANYCIDRVSAGKAMLCIQNVSTGRETTLPHDIAPSSARRKILIIGGGPAGLEAARCAALRGHDVVLLEGEQKLGGQLRLATVPDWRGNLSGITRWLEMQVRKLGVDIRTGLRATADMVLAEDADDVIIATGGTPARPAFPGVDKSVTSWSILSGETEPQKNVLLYDMVGTHSGVTVADHLANRGSLVEIVTPDQMIGEEIGGTARSSFMRRLYARNVIMTPSHHLDEIFLEGNSLIAVLREEHSGREEERAVDQVVIDCGTLPVDDLYMTLRPQSINLGELDQRAFIQLAPQTIATNPSGRYRLFRIGDAVMARNVHASMYEAARLARSL